MQYAGQIKSKLKARFQEHLTKMENPNKIQAFLKTHFKCNGNYLQSQEYIKVQPVDLYEK